MADYDHQVKQLMSAGFTDSQVDVLIELFEPLKPRKEVKHRQAKYKIGDMDSARYIFDLILMKFPDTKAPNFEQWADDLRKLREIDKIPPLKIAEVFQWAHNHHFWSANILSPGKLRKQWEKLCAQKQTEGENGPNQHI